MSGVFRAGAMELAEEVARAHEAGPGLPAAEIGARSRRRRRRREVGLLAVTGAAVAAVALGGAALLDRGAAAPPAGPPVGESIPSSVDPTEPAERATGAPTSSPAEGSPMAPAPVDVLTAADLDRIALDVDALTAALAGLGELEPWPTEPGIVWGLDPAVVISPQETCRPLLTVVNEAPGDYGVVGWSSGAASVSQELVVLEDERTAASAFEVLEGAYGSCPEVVASLPEMGGARHVVTALGVDEEGLSSLRASGSEWGEGTDSAWIQVDVLVANAILRTEVYVFGAPSAGETDASAVGDVVERAVHDGLATAG